MYAPPHVLDRRIADDAVETIADVQIYISIPQIFK